MDTFNHRDSIIAAAPLALLAVLILFITIFLKAVGGPDNLENMGDAAAWHSSAIIVSLLATLFISCCAVLTIKLKHLPIWVLSGLPVIFAGSFVSLNLVLDDRPWSISLPVDILFLAYYLIVSLISFVGIIIKGWRDAGLMSLSLCGALGLSLCFFIIADAPSFKFTLIVLLAGIFEPLFIYLYLRKSDTFRIIAIASIGIINSGIAWAAEETFRQAYPSRDISQCVFLIILLWLILIGGTLLGFSSNLLKRKSLKNSMHNQSVDPAWEIPADEAKD